MWSSDTGTIAHVYAYTCICTDIHTTDKLFISQSEKGNRKRMGGSCDLRQAGRNELRLLTPFYKPPPAAAH